VADLAHRADLTRRELGLLAAAGALQSLAGHRHQAWWQAAGVETRPNLLQQAPVAEAPAALRPPTEGQDLIADYQSLGFTLGRHPLALLRRKLQHLNYLTGTALQALPSRSRARMAGLVINRQRPGTASGTVFVTLEDETGHINVIVWASLGDRQRRELLGARLLGVEGMVEREGEVLHLIAGHLTDHSALLQTLPARSRDFH
jgi:error-prone DNA polymerase